MTHRGGALLSALTDSISVTPSTGGYSLWIKLPPQLSAQQLHQQIDKSKIDFLSGELFSLEMRFKQFIRLIIMPALNEKTYAGIDHLISVIKKHTD